MNIRQFGAVLGAVVFAAGLLAGVCAAGEDATFSSNSKCKMCHNKSKEGEQWKKWSEMKHAKAFETLSSDAAKEYATAAGLTTAAAESPECVRCHVTGYDAEKAAFAEGIDKEDGVQCDACHGPSSEHLAFGKKMMMKKDEITPEMDKMIAMPDEKVCVKCHNDESPAWDTKKYTLKDGSTAGFDFEQAAAKIAHANPEKE